MPFAFLWLWFVSLLFFAPFEARGQSPETKPVGSDQRSLTAEQIDALVAPIALYPDPLLAEVLMASTYPLEVVQADRWLRSKKQLTEDTLKTESAKQPWDKSVKSLVATPSVLEMMGAQLEWTQKLGDAVLAQQADVMAAIQRLRFKAHENKKLSSGKEQIVSVTQAEGKQVIAIEPATPDTVFVPYYDPAAAYGPWPSSEYPPYYFPPPPWISPELIGSGIAFGAGFLLGRWTSGGNYWGGGIGWGNGNIDINRPIHGRGDHVAHWRHDPQHRRGVGYTNSNVRQRFSGTDNPARSEARQELRKRGDTLTPSKGRSGVAKGQAGHSKKAATVAAKKGAGARKGASKSSSVKAKKVAQNRNKSHAKARSGRSGSARRSSHQARYNKSHVRRSAYSGRSRARHGGGVRRGGGRRR